MTFKIEHFSMNGKHITLEPDGSIELYLIGGLNEGSEVDPIVIEYSQAKILKAMIIAEYELEKRQ